MLDRVKDIVAEKITLETDKDGNPAERDVQIAILALLLDMGHIHNELASEEISALVKSMFRHFGLLNEHTGELMEVADYFRTEATAKDKLFQLINAHYDPSQRQAILGMVWKIIEADNLVDAYESKLATEVRTRLNLTMEQALRARQLAEMGEV